MKIALSIATVFLTGLCVAAQTTPSTALPRIHFTFDHPELAVAHYEIDMDANGKAHYESKVRGQEKGTLDDGLSRDFTVSAGTRDSIFALIKSAHNLDGSFDYTKHKVAFTGTKTINLVDANGEHTAKFVWSENESLVRLADLFQGISGTLEEEPVLQRLRRYDKLGLNAELGKMEKLAESGWLRELNLISDVLKDIATDAGIMGVARKRAEHLLQKAAVSAGNET
jgi:hypothetical protein